MSKSSVKHCRFLLQKLPKLFDFWKTTLAKTLLFLSQIDMCPFCHFWSKKPIKNVGLQTTFQHVIILWFCDPPFGSRTLLFLSQIDFAKSGNFPFFAKSIWHYKTKGMGITFSDQKSPKGTMSKSSVKHCRFCMTFRTKSDKTATCRFGVENVTFWTTSASSASAPAIGSKEATEPIKNDSAYNLFQHVPPCRKVV